MFHRSAHLPRLDAELSSKKSMTAALPSLEPGQRWAYQHRTSDRYCEVELLRIGDRRPPRVLVRFIDLDAEGAEEWVTPKRLKVLWTDVEELIAKDARWEGVRTSSLQDPIESAALHVFDTLIGNEIAHMEYSGHYGIMRIKQPERLAAITGLDLQDFEYPSSFVEDGQMVVPWTVTEQVALSALRANPDPILEALVREEQEAEHKAIYGSATDGGYILSGPECKAIDDEHFRPVREQIREWAGVAAAERIDELVALREEIARVGQIAETAIAALHTAGRTNKANELRRQLGVLENSKI